MAFVPDELLETLAKKGVRKTDAPLLPSEENEKRYGFPFPRDLRELFRLADEWAIEDVPLGSFRYVRAASRGWELPPPAPDLLWTSMQRFEWSTSSNMQLWEHLAGLVSIGRDHDESRWFASIASDAAPVFWIDERYGAFTTGHGDDRAIVGGCVASSLKTFLRVAIGDSSVRDPERTLVKDPSRPGRDDDIDWLDPMVPLRAWPPFLAARSEWILGALLYEDAASHLDAPAVRCFDVDREIALVSESEPLALYWLLRSFLLREKDVFLRAAAEAKKRPTPLVASAIGMLEPRLDDPNDAPGALAKARSVVASAGDAAPRTPAFPDDLSPDALFDQQGERGSR